MTMTASPTPRPKPKPFREEFIAVWRQIPDKGLFFGLLGAWLLLFQFLGNPTVGYVNTRSLYAWLQWMYDNSGGDESHGPLIPLAVMVLFWAKREELLAVTKRPWWPPLGMLALALGLHMVGSIVQQTQVCAVAFFLGIYAIMGITWGPQWMLASFFPTCLFAFCVPIKNVSEFLTFPLRMIATKISAVLTQSVLGINIIHDGTRIFDALGRYQYEVAAACSGLRSLTAISALAVIYAFMMLRSPWRRLAMIASALPLAIAANVVRLVAIIVAAETFGQESGNAVHDSTWMSLVPYVPAILGIFLLGRLLREDAPASSPLPATPVSAPVEESKI